MVVVHVVYGFRLPNPWSEARTGLLSAVATGCFSHIRSLRLRRPQLCLSDLDACFLSHLPPQGFLPRLTSFLSACRESPRFPILRSQHNFSVVCQTNTTRTVALSFWHIVRRKPGDENILSTRFYLKCFEFRSWSRCLRHLVPLRNSMIGRVGTIADNVLAP